MIKLKYFKNNKKKNILKIKYFKDKKIGYQKLYNNYFKNNKVRYQKLYNNYFKNNKDFKKYIRFKNNYFILLKNIKRKKSIFFKFIKYKLNLKIIKKYYIKYPNRNPKPLRFYFLSYKNRRKIFFFKEELLYFKKYLYREDNLTFFRDRRRYNLTFLGINFLKRLKKLIFYTKFKLNNNNFYFFKFNSIFKFYDRFKFNLNLNAAIIKLSYINFYSSYYLFNNLVSLNYTLRKKIFYNKIFFLMYFKLLKKKVFYLRKKKKLKRNKHYVFKYKSLKKKYIYYKNFYYYKYKLKRKPKSFSFKFKIHYRYNYKLKLHPKILNLILFNIYNFYLKNAGFKSYVFRKYSKKLFINNFKIKHIINKVKPKKLKFIFKTYKKYKLINFKLTNNYKNIILNKFSRYKNLGVIKNKNQNLLLFLTIIRGFTFDSTLNQFIVDIDYFSNKLFSLLSIFSIENVNLSFGNYLESMRSRSNFLIYNYFKTIKLNMFEKLYKNFKFLINKKKNYKLKFKKNRHFRSYKKLKKNNFIHSYALYKNLKFNQKKETYISKRFLFKYLEYFFSLSLFKFNFNLILFGFKQNDKFLLPMIKIIKLKYLINFKDIKNFPINNFIIMPLKNLVLSIKYIFNKYMLNNLIELILKDVILFFIYFIFLQKQLKKLIIKKILCHN